MAIIDIIMSAYNEEKCIERALLSIIGQEFTEWKLLVCDDFSEDKTLDILKEYEKKYPTKIIVFHNEKNMGLTYSLNRLISESTAPYIARMDADDICNSRRLQVEKEFLDNHKEFAMVGCNINKFDEQGIFATFKYPEVPNKVNLLWNSPFAHPTIMIKSEVLKELNGYKGIKRTTRCEDYDMWFRLYAAGYRGYNIQEPLLDYCENRNSYGKRKFRYRIAEAATRLNGYRINHLMPIGAIFILKPIFVGLIPNRLLIQIRKYKK